MAEAVGNNHSGPLRGVEEGKGHCSSGTGDTTSPTCKRGERWIQRWRQREREIQTGRLPETQRSESARTRDREEKTKDRGKWIWPYRAPPHSTQRPTRGNIPSRRASAVMCSQRVCGAYHSDRSVYCSLINHLRALQTPAINCSLPEEPMTGGWVAVNLRASAQRNITQPSKVVIRKTTPAEEIADSKALELATHRIYLRCEPYKGKPVSTRL